MASEAQRGDLVVSANVTIPAADLSWSASRAGGPGGQHVNKTSTKVDLRFDLRGSTALTMTVKRRLTALAAGRLDGEGRIVITSAASRSQTNNLLEARERLAALVRAALVVPKRRRATRPSLGAKRRRLDAKRQ
ncbi:MAG: alternative ribosome rescue aminoacyl-tRNA hydrolase ArfB, partial [Myxococcota bacterium]